MLEVDIDKILPVTEARDNFNKIIDEVEGTDHMYVLTKNGKPSAVVVGVNHLEKLTGKSADELTSMVEKKADSTPVVEEVNPSVPTESVGAPVPTESVETLAGGSKPPAQVPTDNVGAPGPMATGQSIQPGQSSSPLPPLEVPPETPASIPTSSPTNVGASPSAPLSGTPASGELPLPAPTSSAQRAPSDSGPGSVAASVPTENVGGPGVASNQAPMPPNNPPTGGAAKSDSDLFV